MRVLITTLREGGEEGGQRARFYTYIHLQGAVVSEGESCKSSEHPSGPKQDKGNKYNTIKYTSTYCSAHSRSLGNPLKTLFPQVMSDY